jgi:hypothetical protein
MNAAYLHWLDDVFQEAQVPHGPDSGAQLDAVLRRLTGLPGAPEEDVYNAIRQRWLRFGPSGRQLLAALLRHEVFARRDSPRRPQEGVGYYVNR